MEVKLERHGFRDEALSRRHRAYGFDCPMQDIDFCVAEYDYYKPKALIEHKHERADLQSKTDPGFKVLINLANMAKLPAYAVRYSDDLSRYFVVPLNDMACQFLEVRTLMNEWDYVTFLYELRDRTPPKGLKEKLQCLI